MPSKSNPEKDVGFGLYLGCEKEVNTIHVRNSNHDHKSTKKFKVSASNSSSRGESANQVIFSEINLEDTRSKDLNNIPILRFHFNNTLTQYVYFHLSEYYGKQGGGLNYFNIFQDLNEYIKQTADFPRLSHEEDTGRMCGVNLGQKLETSYRVHYNVSSWGECLRRCSADPECKAWSLNQDNGRCKQSKNDQTTQAPNYPDLVTGSWHCEIFYFDNLYF